MSAHLTVIDLLLLQSAAAGEFSVRPSRGYDDDKPEGWPVILFRGRAVVSDCDQGRLSDLERVGYLVEWGEEGPIEVSADGRLVLLNACVS